MKSFEKILIDPKATIKEALGIIDQGGMKIALVVDPQLKLLGTITDGDIRRAFLKGNDINDQIKSIYNNQPITLKLNDPKEKFIHIAVQNRIFKLPVVNDEGLLIGLEDVNEYISESPHSNLVVLMVGGLGTRLRPLTQDTPKPLLKIGDKSLLQTIIENFSGYGFKNFILSVNYKSNLIREHFKDGSHLGTNIDYIEEENRMGTAGSLSLLKKKPGEPFFVMNGDILTNINLEHLLDYHALNKANATIAIREVHFEIPYGVVFNKENQIINIEEKPRHSVFINAGIYLLDPDCLDLLPKNEYVDMPNFINMLIKKKMNVVSYPIREYWLDIGKHEDYKKAQTDFNTIFDSNF